MLLNLQNLPGIDASVETAENEFTWGPNAPVPLVGGTIDSTAVDSGNTPTTTLRRGLVMGRIASTSKFVHYDPAATDGSQDPIGILFMTVNMYDSATAATRDKQGVVLPWGFVKVGQLYGFDEYARGRLRNLFPDDLRQLSLFKPVSKTTDYTVVAADNGTHFFTLGAAGAVNFTLPAITNCRGYRFRFSNVVDQNMTITAPAGKLVTFNNAAATSVAFSTAGNKIGASMEIVGLPDSSKYLVIPSGANTMTVA